MSKTGIIAEVRHTDLYGWDVVYLLTAHTLSGNSSVHLLRGYEVGRDHIGKGNTARIDAYERADRYNTSQPQTARAVSE